MYEKCIAFHILLFGLGAILAEADPTLQIQTASHTSTPLRKISCKGKLADISSSLELYNELLPLVISEFDSEEEQSMKKAFIKSLTHSESFGRSLNCQIGNKARLLQEDEEEDEEEAGSEVAAEPALTGAIRPLLGVTNILSNIFSGNIGGIVDSSIGIGIQNVPAVNTAFQTVFSNIFGNNVTAQFVAAISNITMTTEGPSTPAQEDMQQKQEILNSTEVVDLQTTPSYPDSTTLGHHPTIRGGQKRRTQSLNSWIASNAGLFSALTEGPISTSPETVTGKQTEKQTDSDTENYSEDGQQLI